MNIWKSVFHFIWFDLGQFFGISCYFSIFLWSFSPLLLLLWIHFFLLRILTFQRENPNFHVIAASNLWDRSKLEILLSNWVGLLFFWILYSISVQFQFLTNLIFERPTSWISLRPRCIKENRASEKLNNLKFKI